MIDRRRKLLQISRSFIFKYLPPILSIQFFIANICTDFSLFFHMHVRMMPSMEKVHMKCVQACAFKVFPNFACRCDSKHYLSHTYRGTGLEKKDANTYTLYELKTLWFVL